MGLSRKLTLLVILPVALCGPAGAQQMMRMLERGPVGYLHGQTLLQQSGNLTAGDFSQPAVADWDGDGRLDLVVGSGYGDLLLFRAGEGGLFEPAQALIPETELRLDAAPQRKQVSPWLGDLNGDGALDLLLGIEGRVYRYRISGGTPGEGVALVGERDLPQVTGPVAPCAMDCDGDGALDLLMADGLGRLMWLPLGAGPGEVPRALTVGALPITATPPARPCAADWDGDGLTDLLVGDGPGTVTLYRRTPTGFAPGEVLGGAEVRWLPGGLQARAVAPWAADWDGDGDMDLLLGCRRGFALLVERVEQTRLRVAGYLLQRDAPVDAGRCAVGAPGDWDGDGDIDLVVGGEDGYVSLFLRLPGPGLVFERGRTIADDHGPVRAGGSDEYLRYAAPALADWDGDGDADLLVGCGSGEVLAWSNAGGLHPLGPVQVSGMKLSVDGIAIPAPCDANGDGDTDLFLGARRPPREGAPPAEIELPRFAPNVAYYENIAHQIGALPRFAKGVPIAMTLFSPGDPPLNRDADFMAPYAIWPARWRDRSTVDFIAATDYGTFAFTNLARPGQYVRLQLQCRGRSLPSPLLPPLYFARPVELAPGQVGLLAADEAYGFLCYYPRELFPE